MPVFRNAGSFAFVTKSDRPLIEHGQTSSQSLADTQAKSLFDHLEPFEVCSSQPDASLLNNLLQHNKPTLNQSNHELEESDRFRRDGISASEIPPAVKVLDVPEETTGTEIFSSESKYLPLDWILNPNKSSLAARAVAHLIVSEAKEVNPHLRDDLRISQLTLIHLERGDAVECSAFVLATYEVLGCHPEQVWGRILARRAANLGRAGAGERSSSHMNMLPGLSSLAEGFKKPNQSVGTSKSEKEQA